MIANVRPGAAQTATGGASILCHMATAAAERSNGVPDQLLDAISRVESGRLDSATATMRAWPWTINAQGIGHFYASKAEAIAAAQQFRAQGIQSMDVGCMQVNLMYHPDAFASLDQAFDPQANALYAAHLLTQLFAQTGSWPHAAAAYHSQTPELGNDYQRKVLEAWAEPEDTPHGRPASERRARTPSAAPELSSQFASLGAGVGPVPPSGGPLLGGIGRIIRNSGPVQTHVSGQGLAAYRSMPIAMVAFAGQRRPD
ncbi:transglycosylase SLT domain-containing protein [Endobacter medicaginis]|nr:transglycosylase SLT domain-containing protein [Endobacter medicaginis]